VTGSAGTQIGTLHADLQALAISADAIIPADGTVLEDDPAKYTSNPCAPGLHTAVWLLHVVVSGQTIDVPVYVDTPAPAADPLGQGAPVKLKLLNAKLTVNQGIVVNPSVRGEYPWRAIVTPYTVNSGTPNAAGTVEARAFVELPTQLNLSGKVKAIAHKKKVRGKVHVTFSSVAILTGSLVENLKGIGGVKVTISSGPTLAKLNARGIATTNAGGDFSRQLSLSGKTSFQASATVDVRDYTSTGCSTPTPGIPCVSATLPGFTETSPLVTLAPKKH
jgi:hypothetical protein